MLNAQIYSKTAKFTLNSCTSEQAQPSTPSDIDLSIWQCDPGVAGEIDDLFGEGLIARKMYSWLNAKMLN